MLSLRNLRISLKMMKGEEAGNASSGTASFWLRVKGYCHGKKMEEIWSDIAKGNDTFWAFDSDKKFLIYTFPQKSSSIWGEIDLPHGSPTHREAAMRNLKFKPFWRQRKLNGRDYGKRECSKTGTGKICFLMTECSQADMSITSSGMRKLERHINLRVGFMQACRHRQISPG